jgi:RNA polymerase sigma-70 factor (ECF subfamily)
VAKVGVADDRDLIERLLRGDADAVEIAGSWIDEVLRQQFRGLREEWDDLRQETLRRIYQNLHHDHFEGRSALHTYIHRVAMNVAIDVSRRAYRKRQQIAAAGDAAERAYPPISERVVVAGDLVRRLLQRLSEGDRLLLRLVYGDHQSYVEVARTLGTTEAAIKVRMKRCKARILSLHRRLVT